MLNTQCFVNRQREFDPERVAGNGLRNSAVISSVRFVLGLETFWPPNPQFKLKGLEDLGFWFEPRVYISEVA